MLFLSNNRLSTVPSFALLTSLRVLSLRANDLTRLDVNSLPPQLEQLILTDNKLVSLPMHLNALPLRKIMATRNALEFLPDDFASQPQLELVRLSQNGLVALPRGFWSMPRLAWVALASNPLLGRQPTSPVEDTIRFQDLALEDKLGEGTSGIVYRAQYQNTQVSVKLYKQSGSDGDVMVRT